MPYVTKDTRKHLVEHAIDELKKGRVAWVDEIRTAGEIQYVIAEICQSYVSRTKMCYSTLNDVMGALAGAQMEFYRQVVAPYEDKKIKQNGAVYSHYCKEK